MLLYVVLVNDFLTKTKSVIKIDAKHKTNKKEVFFFARHLFFSFSFPKKRVVFVLSATETENARDKDARLFPLFLESIDRRKEGRTSE